MSRYLFSGVSEQAKAARHRMDDARTLFNATRWRGAMYLAGYSLECLLKAKLMRMFGCQHLLELDDDLRRRGLLSADATVFTHQLRLLMGLTQRLDQLRQNQAEWSLFNLVNLWMPAWRYTADLSNMDDARDFLNAVDTISRWVENNI
jgi:HEPN domain-containing protein